MCTFVGEHDGVYLYMIKLCMPVGQQDLTLSQWSRFLFEGAIVSTCSHPKVHDYECTHHKSCSGGGNMFNIV